jgi:hypothetical protein
MNYYVLPNNNRCSILCFCIQHFQLEQSRYQTIKQLLTAKEQSLLFPWNDALQYAGGKSIIMPVCTYCKSL